MKDFQKRREIRKKMYSNVVLAVVVIIAILSLQGVWGVWRKERISRANLRSLEENLEKTKKRDAELSENLKEIESSDGIEKEIRNKFSVTKPGESVVLIVDQKATASDVVEEGGFFSKIKRWFSEKF